MNGLKFNRSDFAGDHTCPQSSAILNGRLQHAPDEGNSCEDESKVDCDYFNGVFDYIKQMLMDDDDSEDRFPIFQDYYSLQVAEKYFHDALLSDKDPPSLDVNTVYRKPREANSVYVNVQIGEEALGNVDSLSNSNGFLGSLTRDFVNLDSVLQEKSLAGGGRDRRANSTNSESCGRKNHRRGEIDDCDEERNCKQMASLADELDQTERYDKCLLCSKMNPGFYDESSIADHEESLNEEDENLRLFRESTVVKRGRPKGSKNRKATEVIDLRDLLLRCAEAVSSLNIRASQEILKKIRHYSSPSGDANERLAHYFGNALEARMTGTGSASYHAFTTRRISTSDLLKSYQTYVAICPFKRMSNIFANKSIGRHSRRATRIHIIDFGIQYGFQWPCFIQGVSLRPGGAPLLKITGIDFPQPGLKPLAGVEQTGSQLVNYCKRFNVPFEYNAIANKWEGIRLEELKIKRDEMVIVNCMYRLDHVPAESAGVDSPRDDVLKLIKKINPDLFVHGVINGTYNSPFFTTRFRETMHHYSSFFDMLEATIPRENPDRLMRERELFGREIMNCVACEGLERVERPETYKQWQVRNWRAGFSQLPLNREIVKEVKIKVKKDYHSYFLLDEESEWMLHGWKGRVMYALSCWKPIQE